MTVTVAVVHWNSLAVLPACLEALQGTPGLHTVVADNASPDGGEALICERFQQVSWQRMEANLGFGSAVNAVSRRSSGEWILALNPDTRLDAPVLADMVAAAEALGAAALGPKILDPQGCVERSYGSRDSVGGDVARWLASHFPGSWRPATRPVDVAWLTGACLLLRRDVFEQLGGFDERYFLYFEDMDLCRRLRRAGRRVVFHPGFVAVHQRGASGRTESARVQQEYRSSQLLYAREHRPRWYHALTRAGLRLRAALWSAPWGPEERRRLGRGLREVLKREGGRFS